jgi:hypothetical protein
MAQADHMLILGFLRGLRDEYRGKWTLVASGVPHKTRIALLPYQYLEDQPLATNMHTKENYANKCEHDASA